MGAPASLAELAVLVKGQLQGDGDLRIWALNGLELAGEGEITFILHARQVEELKQGKASACIVPAEVEVEGLPLIKVEQADVAAAIIHQYLLETPFQARGVHPAAVIGVDCHIPAAVTIGAGACIGDRVRLGERVRIGAGVVIEDDVTIGDDTVVHANVTIAERCRIGKRVVLHHGAVIGSDGFGFAIDKTTGRHYTSPQVGTVRLDDDVQVGACSCIDRATFGTTWIKAGVRIDNLVQVAHNVEVGENSVLVAQVGIAGSTRLGRGVMLGGKTAVAGHLELGDRVMAAAASGIHNNQPAGARVGGVPATDSKIWGRAMAVLYRLPEMRRELRRLRKEVMRLSAENESRQGSEDSA